MNDVPRRVAIVKLSALGDVVHALPVASALEAARPDISISWIVERREAALLRGHPAIDEVIEADTRGLRRARGPRTFAAALATLAALGRHIARAGFDAALDLQGLVKSGLVTAATRAPLRVGFAARFCREPLNALFTNRRVRPAAARHAVEECLSLLGPLGITAPRVAFALPVDPVAEARVDEWFDVAGLKPRRRLVVLNPGAGWSAKRWPAARFRVLAERLGAEAGASVLVLWGPGERADAQAIAAVAGAVLAPPTDVRELSAVMRRASVVVAADTGPLHLAAAAGTPCVGLYGPTPARNAPYGAAHAVMRGRDGAMTSIDVASVYAAVVERLGS